MEENDISPTPLADGVNVLPADGQGTASPKEEVVNVKDLLGETLGQTFESDEVALKAVTDTFSYVGKAGKYEKAIKAVREAHGFGNDEQAIKYLMDEANKPATPAPASAPATPTPQGEGSFVTKEQYQSDMFFGGKPELAPYRTVIESLQKSTGKNLAEVVELPEFKTLWEKAAVGDEVQKSKSVLMSNPRIGQISDKITEGREALKTNDFNKAADAATAAVVDLMRE